MGRPSSLTPDLREAIERELATGASQAVVAQRAGIHPRTLERWLARGQIERRPAEPAPADELTLPERLARAEPGLVVSILAAAQRGSWQAAAWILERRFPERWLKPAERPPGLPAEPDDPFAEVIDLARRRQR